LIREYEDFNAPGKQHPSDHLTNQSDANLSTLVSNSQQTNNQGSHLDTAKQTAPIKQHWNILQNSISNAKKGGALLDHIKPVPRSNRDQVLNKLPAVSYSIKLAAFPTEVSSKDATGRQEGEDKENEFTSSNKAKLTTNFFINAWYQENRPQKTLDNLFEVQCKHRLATFNVQARGNAEQDHSTTLD